jgi:hypothetical protein
MLGTGTQLDPYQITTVAEFRSMNDSTAYYKLMNDLDVNDSEWASNWTQATIACKQIDFNGYELRNINGANAFYTSADIEFYNPKLINIVLTGADCCFCSTPSGIVVAFTGGGENNVGQLSMQFMGDRINNGLLATGVLQLTNIAGTINATSNSFDKGLGRTISTTYAATSSLNVHLNINWHVTNSTSGYILYGRGSNCKSIKTMIIGKFSAGSGATQGDFKLFDFRDSSATSQCYCAVEFDNISNVKFADSSPDTTCFYDAELAGITMTAQTNVHALTTEQCKDKDYLNSIGFVVV